MTASIAVGAGVFIPANAQHQNRLPVKFILLLNNHVKVEEHQKEGRKEEKSEH